MIRWISLSFGELRTLRNLPRPSDETWSTWKLSPADETTTVTRSCKTLNDLKYSPMADDSKTNRYSIHSLGRNSCHDDQIQALLPNEEQQDGEGKSTDENPNSPSGQDASATEDAKTSPDASQSVGNATVSVNIPTEKIEFQPPIEHKEGHNTKSKFVFFKRIPASPARVKPPIQMNAFAQKKTLAQGLMDIALLTANASQMKLVLTEGPDRVLFYHFLMTMLCLSVICQCFVGFLLLYKARLNIEDEHEQHAADKANNWATALVMLITIINVFISSFGIKLEEPKATTAAQAPAPPSGTDNT
ncbi:PREDICTED: uncharacterized protein LOC109476406 [Branchiostoma belcheri]|uniref:Uncharacterized protein LOC109476406 n=1 Tax=Branchiostoma belcheri TaxID=7741 RepID=A0A6P4ZTI2_BRABE|nr:PREDICTED: uncharacterized protein LOC109476406 [Branchiostoma belcheri]